MVVEICKLEGPQARASKVGYASHSQGSGDDASRMARLMLWLIESVWKAMIGTSGNLDEFKSKYYWCNGPDGEGGCELPRDYDHNVPEDPEEEIHPMVSEEYLMTLVDLDNERFVTNKERKERFAKDLLQPKGEEKTKKGDAGEWDDKDVRRERKRQEGFRRKEELEKQRQAREAEAKVHDTNNGDLGTKGLQMHESVAKGDLLPAKKPKMLAERGHNPVVHQKQADI